MSGVEATLPPFAGFGQVAIFVRCSDSLFKDHLAQLMSPNTLIIVKWSISTTNVEKEVARIVPV
jgi:hypothetical protein